MYRQQQKSTSKIISYNFRDVIETTKKQSKGQERLLKLVLMALQELGFKLDIKVDDKDTFFELYTTDPEANETFVNFMYNQAQMHPAIVRESDIDLKR